MSDDEVISCCHCYCKEHHLTAEWKAFREQFESQYIDGGDCYDLQMISGGFITPSALPERTVDKEQCPAHC